VLAFFLTVVAARLVPHSFPASVRVRLDWEWRPDDRRSERAEALLRDLASALHEASGRRWCLKRFVVDDGYTPFNPKEEGVIYFHEKWTPPPAQGSAGETFADDWQKDKAGTLSHPGWVHLGLNLFKDDMTSRQGYARSAAGKVLLAWTGKESLPASPKPVPFASPVIRHRYGLKVVIQTGPDRAGGTDDRVWLDFGTGRKLLDNPGKNDFLPGAEDVFYLFPGRHFTGKAVPFVRLIKDRDGYGGAWLLQSVELFYQGESIYRRPCILKWFKGRDRQWEGSGARSIEKQPLRPDDEIKSLVALIQTGDDPLAGCASAVYLHLGKERVKLQRRAVAQLTPGSLTIVRVKPRRLKTIADLNSIRLTRSASKLDRGWQMKSLSVYVNDQLVYEKKNASVWLRRGKLEWEATDYTPPTRETGTPKGLEKS